MDSFPSIERSPVDRSTAFFLGVGRLLLYPEFLWIPSSLLICILWSIDRALENVPIVLVLLYSAHVSLSSLARCIGMVLDSTILPGKVTDLHINATRLILFIVALFAYPCVIAFSSLLPSKKQLAVAFLPLLPGILFGRETGRVNTFTPEGKGGIVSALTFHLFQIAFPKYLQWVQYAGVSMPHPRMIRMFLEWTLCTTVWCYYDLPIDVSYGLSLFVNTFVHAFRLQLTRHGRPSKIVFRERFGAIWFAVTSLVMNLLRWSLGVWISALWSSSLWIPRLCWTAIVMLVAFVIIIQRDPAPFTTYATQNASNSNAKEFQHEKIEHQNVIRLLRLYQRPLFSNGPITCDIVNATLGRTPMYIAISYTWGTGKNDCDILINGLPYKVSSTVHAILEAKRSRWRSRCIWIDAICINQIDDEEKTQQVGLMRDIFEGASYVIGWLGDEPDAAAASTLIGRIYTWRFLHDTSAATVVRKYISDNDAEAWAALRKLISHPFFERIWIVQEIAVAAHPFLRYGKEEIPWQIFARAMMVLSQSGLRDHIFLPEGKLDSFWSAYGLDNVLVMENLKRCCLTSRNSDLLAMTDRIDLRWKLKSKNNANEDLLPLKDTLKLCLGFKSTLPVDRIYALLGIVAERNNPPIRPDYRKTTLVESVYTEVTQYLVRQREAFSFLHHAGVGQPRNPKIKGLPSWVPDWSATLETCTLACARSDAENHASQGLQSNVEFSPNDPKVLCINGIYIDKIVHLADLSHDPIDPQADIRITARSIFESRLQKYQHVLNLVHNHPNSPYHPTSLEEAFWRTAIADTDPGKRSPASRQHWERWRSWIHGTTSSSEVKVADALSSCPFPPSPHPSPTSPFMRALRFFVFTTRLQESSNIKFAHLLATEITQSNAGLAGDFCSILEHVPGYYRAEVDFTVGRRFAITERGYIGLVPMLARRGDEVVVLGGGRTPFVVRPCVDGVLSGSLSGCMKLAEDVVKNEYILVGESYFHGMMSGEMVKERKGFQREQMFRFR